MQPIKPPYTPPKPNVTVTPSLPSLPSLNKQYIKPSEKCGSTCLIYGESRTFKTSQLALIAMYTYEKTGKPTRYITADTGGWGHIQQYIDSGIIQLYKIDEEHNPLTQVRALMAGGWNPYTLPDGKIQFEPPAINGLYDKKVGAYHIEGLTSIATRLLRFLAKKGIKISQEVVGQFFDQSMMEGVSQSEGFAAPAQSHYGFVQNFVFDMMAAFSNLPVDQVIFTAHESKGEDTLSRTPVFGPGVVGKAATANVAWQVGDMFHCQSAVAVPTSPSTKPVTVTNEQKMTVRAYFQKHPDDQVPTILWQAGPRFAKDQIVEFFRKWPEGYIDLNIDSIADYFRLRDNLKGKMVNDLAKWKEEQDHRRATGD